MANVLYYAELNEKLLEGFTVAEVLIGIKQRVAA